MKIRSFIGFLLASGFLNSIKPTIAINRYDKSITVFSPEGRLLQVEYADKASSKGKLVICSQTSDDCIVICTATSKFDAIFDEKKQDKVAKISDGLYMIFSGLLGDAKSFASDAQQFCIQYKNTLDSAPGVSALGNFAGDLQYRSSIYGGNKSTTILTLNSYIMGLFPSFPFSILIGERPYGLNALLLGCDHDTTCKRPKILKMTASG
jgi:20S proteasome alpha/beta subunit